MPAWTAIRLTQSQVAQDCFACQRVCDLRVQSSATDTIQAFFDVRTTKEKPTARHAVGSGCAKTIIACCSFLLFLLSRQGASHDEQWWASAHETDFFAIIG
jgi:hypothetical protein